MDIKKAELIKTENLLDISESIAGDFLDQFEFPWEILPCIANGITRLGQTLPTDKYIQYADNVWISKTANVAQNVHIDGPTIIDHKAEIRHCAYIRGRVVIGEECVVGNSTELKNVILFNKVEVPHYNYVGDSILGYKSHMGAGSITSNVKADKSEVILKHGDYSKYTGLIKFGAIIGDYVEIGCNTVLNPGTVVGRNTNIYPLVAVRGVVPADSIYKKEDNIVKKQQ